MKIQAGQRYVDGWDGEHAIVGQVPGRPGIWYSSRGYWFTDDGRLHYRVSPDMCKHDLVGPAQGELNAIVPSSTNETRLHHSHESASGVENVGHTEVQPDPVQTQAE